MPERLILWIAIIVLTSCEQGRPLPVGRPEAPAEKDMEAFREALISQNRQLVLEEMRSIDAYASRLGLVMDTTSTGLRILVTVRKPGGKKTGLMRDVTITYTLKLTDGTLCASSDSSGPLTFTLGQSAEPSGLQEGLLKMREGEEAIMIVPSFLAFGITGDGHCIPGSSSIIYKVKIEKVED